MPVDAEPPSIPRSLILLDALWQATAIGRDEIWPLHRLCGELGIEGAAEIPCGNADRLRPLLRLNILVECHRRFLIEHGPGKPMRGPGQSASGRASASRPGASRGCSALWKPQAAPSAARIARPGNNNSAARPCPMIRGEIPQAPMSAPASPAPASRNAVFASSVASPRRDRRSCA
jgi:hypothetical protein